MRLGSVLPPLQLQPRIFSQQTRSTGAVARAPLFARAPEDPDDADGRRLGTVPARARTTPPDRVAGIARCPFRLSLHSTFIGMNIPIGTGCSYGENVARLKQGVDVWNERPLHHADLIEADLRGAYLREAYLREADLSGANLDGANLSGAKLHEGNLSWAKLNEANLSEANLHGADLYYPIPIRGSVQGFPYNFGRGIAALNPTFVGLLSATMPLGRSIGIFAGLSYGVVVIAALMLPETKGRDLI
jgi:hypothetical protein